MKKLIKYLFVLLLIAGIASCDNFLTPSVDQNKTTNTAIKSAADLQNTVNGSLDEITSLFGQWTYYGRDFPVTLEASSDNAYSTGATGRFINQDKLDYTPNSGYAGNLWTHSYAAISDLNLALQTTSVDTTAAEIKGIRGQAYALRAFLHLNLLMSYGQQFVNGGGASSMGVPYVTTFAQGNNYPSRDDVSTDWNMIGADFAKAVQLIEPSQTFDNTHMNYWAARGLQSRYALYHEQWDLVKTAAEDIINNGPFSITPAANLKSVWESGTGPQSLFELSFIPSDHHAFANISYIYRDVDPPGTYGDVVVTNDLFNAYENGDVRLNLFTTEGSLHRMSSKYSDINGNDNTRVIRYAEVILNYAEALARTNEQGQALIWINKLASNRNKPAYSSGSVENVLKERRRELAMEGFRLFDLARTGQDIVPGDSNSLQEGTITAGSYRFALPIPQDEINANSNIKQNEGYK